jgi:hypothetical protein
MLLGNAASDPLGLTLRLPFFGVVSIQTILKTILNKYPEHLDAWTGPYNNRTALSIAAGLGNTDIVKLLIETYRANPNIRDGISEISDRRYTPLMNAVFNKHRRTAIAILELDEQQKIYLDFGLACESETDNYSYYNRILALAITKGHPNTASKILEVGQFKIELKIILNHIIKKFNNKDDRIAKQRYKNFVNKMITWATIKCQEDRIDKIMDDPIAGQILNLLSNKTKLFLATVISDSRIAEVIKARLSDEKTGEIDEMSGLVNALTMPDNFESLQLEIAQLQIIRRTIYHFTLNHDAMETAFNSFKHFMERTAGWTMPGGIEDSEMLIIPGLTAKQNNELTMVLFRYFFQEEFPEIMADNVPDAQPTEERQSGKRARPEDKELAKSTENKRPSPEVQSPSSIEQLLKNIERWREV